MTPWSPVAQCGPAVFAKHLLSYGPAGGQGRQGGGLGIGEGLVLLSFSSESHRGASRKSGNGNQGGLSASGAPRRGRWPRCGEAVERSGCLNWF